MWGSSITISSFLDTSSLLAAVDRTYARNTERGSSAEVKSDMDYFDSEGKLRIHVSYNCKISDVSFEL